METTNTFRDSTETTNTSSENDSSSESLRGKVSEIAGQTQDEVKAVATEAKEQAKEAVATAKEQAGEAVAQTRQKAAELADRTRGQIRDQLATQKETASGTLGDFAAALQQTGDTLRDRGQATASDYTGAVADQAERISGYLREHDVEQLARDSEDFARRQPTLFLGGAFVLGVLAARFLKSSQHHVVQSGAYSDAEREGALVPVADSGATDNAAADLPAPGAVRTAHGYVPGGVAGSGVQPPPDRGTPQPTTGQT